MKIVQINAVYKSGSTGRTTEEFHLYCKEHGIESYVFCPNLSIPEDGIFRIGTTLDHKAHAVASRLSGRQGCFSYFPTRRLIAKLDDIKPDAVILRNLHGNYIHLPMLLSYLAKKDIFTVPVLHDCWFFTGHCTHYTAHKCYKWQKACEKCPLMNTDNPSLLFDTSNSMFRLKKSLMESIPRVGVIGVSKWITNEGHNSVVFKTAKAFETVYNWIDHKKFYPRESSFLRRKLGINDDYVVLGVAQGWSWRKGLVHYTTLAKNMPDIKIVLIGKIEEKISLPPNILTPGSTESIEQLAEYYSLADVLLVCSVQETFGKVSAEALACGTPVIANNATANPEIPGPDCGIYVDNNDPGQIVDAVESIRRSGKSHYTQACIDRAAKEFDKDIQISKYIRFIERFIRHKHKSI